MNKILALLGFLIVTSSCAQDFDKVDKSVMDVAYYPAKATKRVFEKTDEAKMALTPKMRVIYSRPLKKGREIFGSLVAFDKPWRLGANERTELLLLSDVEIGGKKVMSGRYTLLAVPSANEWKLTVSNTLDMWGVYTYDSANDVVSVTVPTQKSENVIEALSMVFYQNESSGDVNLKIGWDQTIVELPIKVL